MCLYYLLSCIIQTVNSWTSASKHHSRNATKQAGNLQRAKLKVLGKTWMQQQFPWVAGDATGMSWSPFPSLYHPRLTLSNIWEKNSGYPYSLLLGLLLHSAVPLFIEVSKNKTLAEPGMWRMTRGAQVLQLHHSTWISSSSAQLLPIGNCSQALNSGPRGFIHNTPKYSKPSSTQTHLKFPSSQQLHPKSPWLCPSKLGSQAEWQHCASMDVLGWAKSWTLMEKPKQNSLATALK